MKNEKKIRILHIAQSAGGVAEYLYLLCSNMDEKKYENILICSYDYKEQNRFKDIISQIYYVKMVRNINLIKDVKAIFKLRKIIKKICPDIIYLHSSKAGALGRLSMVFCNKSKIVYNAHGWAFNAGFGKKTKIFALIELLLSKKTDLIINISNSEYITAMDKKIDKNKLITIENGIDFKQFNNIHQYRDKIRNKYNIKKEDILVGVVGRISEQKDPITFVKAAEIICKEKKNVFFMLIGGGELEDEVLKYAKEKEIDKHIIVTGWVQNAKEYISAIDVAVLPSKWEGFGLAIIEYIAAKKPVVATKIGGIADIIDNNNVKGILVPILDYKKLAEAIKLTIYKKDEMLDTINKNYLYCSKRYSIQNVVELHEKIFKNIL